MKWHHKKMGFVKLALSLWVGIFLCCSMALAQKVKVASLPGTDFKKFHTYRWEGISHTETVDADADQVAKQAVDAMMSKKHFAKVAVGENADIQLACQIAVKQKQQWRGYDQHLPASDWSNMSPEEMMTIDVGTLVLDVFDSSGSRLIWHGRAKKTFDEHDDSKNREKSIKKAVAKLSKKFPPKR